MSKERLARAYEKLRGRVLAVRGVNLESVNGRRGVTDNNLVLVLASRASGDGVTTVAMELAEAFVEQGARNVLLIDNTPGRRSLSDVAGAETPTLTETGLEQIQTEERSLGEFIGTGSCCLVPVLAIDGAHLLRSRAWPDSLARLQRDYDLLIVDGGSLESEIPILWGRWADRMLLVTDTSRTTFGQLERVRADLEALDLNVHGVILNKKRHYIPHFLARRLH